MTVPRAIYNRSPDSLPETFVARITELQESANKDRFPVGLVDKRVIACPQCGAFGMNTCWGYWAFTCGGEVDSGDGELTGCPNLIAVNS